MNRLAVYTTAFALFSLTAATAVAQDTDRDPVEPSASQLELNEQGVDAVSEGNFQRAIRLFEASLEIGELNITYTNLGRAYQRAGQCPEAREAYERALEAPPSVDPPPEQVEGAVKNFLQELTEECPGYLDVDCDPEDIELFINDDGPKACQREGGHELIPGRYKLRGEYEDQQMETSVSIDAIERTAVNLELSGFEVGAPVAQEADSIDPPERPASSSRRSGALLLAGSGATLAAGIAFDNLPSQAGNGEVNAINFVPVGFYAATAGLAWMGIRNLRR